MLKWLNERLPLKPFYDKFLGKAFPVHHTFYLGEITLMAFVMLVATGAFLSINYEPSTRPVMTDGVELPAAYLSIQFIDSLPFGKVIRSIHHWSAHIMVAAAFLHLLRILLTGSYKKPRELNWVIGILLLALAVVASFTGYALPFDAFSAAAAKIGYQIAVSIPLIGAWLADVVFGGPFPTELSLPRLNALHILWIPLVIAVLIVAHLGIMFLQKHTQPTYAKKIAPGKILGVPFWPHQALVMAVVFSIIVGFTAILASQFIAHPVEAFGPPTAETVEMKPDWFLIWVYGLLQMIPAGWGFSFLGIKVGPQFLGLVVPILVVVFGLVFPWIDASRQKVPYMEMPSRNPWRTGAALGVVAFFLVTTLAGYKEDLGLSIPFLWFLTIVVPLAVTAVTALLIRTFVGTRSEP
jgi:cytochrome b-561